MIELNLLYLSYAGIAYSIPMLILNKEPYLFIACPLATVDVPVSTAETTELISCPLNKRQ